LILFDVSDFVVALVLDLILSNVLFISPACTTIIWVAMAGLDGFNIFGDEGQLNPEVAEVQEVQWPAQGNVGAARLNWTAVMSTYVLSKFSDLVSEGVRTDKGFKDCHVNAVARELQSYIGQHVTGTQVYNHLRKWRTKWVKICRLKDLSGANWDEDLCMITLDAEHNHGHVSVRVISEMLVFVISMLG